MQGGPYAEGLVGGSSIQVGEGFARTVKASVSYGFAAGADLTIFPLLDWRIVEYSYTRSNALEGIDQSTLTTGIVLRVPVP
jgi:hypothetical protein